MTSPARPYGMRGGAVHRVYTVTVFIVLASLEHVAAQLVPPLYTPIGRTLRVAESTVSIAATLAYAFTYNIRRGQSEPELARLFEAGGEYDHRISRRDLPYIANRRTNVWLVLQGLTAQITFGSLVWLPRLFQAKVQAQGYSESVAIQVGALFATLFQLGGVLSIVGGLIGDRLQRRTPRGRALV